MGHKAAEGGKNVGKKRRMVTRKVWAAGRLMHGVHGTKIIICLCFVLTFLLLTRYNKGNKQ